MDDLVGLLWLEALIQSRTSRGGLAGVSDPLGDRPDPAKTHACRTPGASEAPVLNLVTGVESVDLSRASCER